MTPDISSVLDAHLLNDWQRGLPLVARPFRVMAEACGGAEADVIDRLTLMRESGVIARVGAVVRPNTVGASTLAAVAVPDLDVDRAAGIMSADPGINHVYLRENDWNLWFVATGPDRESVDRSLSRVAAATGSKVIDLRLERPFHIDLGFSLSGPTLNRHVETAAGAEGSAFRPRDGDAELAQALTTGLALVARPFEALGRSLGRSEADVLRRIRELEAAGIFPRLGLIVRHRALGWRSNAMVVWDVPESVVDACGERLARVAGVNLCYRRRRHERDWPFNLYCMIHAKSRDDAFDTLAEATAQADLGPYPRQVLFSLRCFKQTGAMVAAPRSKELA